MIFVSFMYIVFIYSFIYFVFALLLLYLTLNTMWRICMICVYCLTHLEIFSLKYELCLGKGNCSVIWCRCAMSDFTSLGCYRYRAVVGICEPVAVSEPNMSSLQCYSVLSTIAQNLKTKKM